MRGSCTRTAALARAAGLVVGFAADRVLGDPQRHHPVAWFGSAAQHLQHRTYRDAVGAGVLHTGLLVGTVTATGVLVERASARRPLVRMVATAVATWVVLGGRSLEREVLAVAEHLEAGDLPAARERITHLVSRDPSLLDEAGLARAAIESLAENTSDAVTAALWWGGLGGIGGLLGYRATNTLDAMIGYRNPRYLRFGRAAARLDDAANWLPARLGATLAAGRNPQAWRAIREDTADHPSPNGGPIEAAFAGSLGIRLGGSNTYHGITEDRGVLGNGRAATAADATRAVRLGRRVQIGSLVAAVALALLQSEARTVWRRPGRSTSSSA